MPVPRAELTPQWRQPNSRGYNGYRQRFTLGSFGAFGGTEGLNEGEIAAAQLMSRVSNMPLEQAYEAARAVKAGYTDDASARAAGYSTNSTGGVGTPSASAASLFAEAQAQAARLQSGGTSGGSGGYSYDSSGQLVRQAGTDWKAKLKDPKVLAIGAVLLGVILFATTPKRKSA